MLPLWDTKFELKPDTWVFVPTLDTAKAGKEIKRAVERVWKPPTNYFHLKAGGHVKALQAHLPNVVFAHLDIQNFFGSINKSRVTRCLKEFFGYEEARRMANISTVMHPTTKQWILPFGFVQSPILASLCLRKSSLGICIDKLTKKYGVEASVYVDDIILSCNDENALRKAMAELKLAAERANFDLNAKKEEGPSPTITAFNVQLSHLSLQVEPDRFAEFVASFNGTENECVRNGIRGYLNSINPRQVALL